MCFLVYFVWVRNDPMGKKICLILEIFCPLNQNLCEFHTFETKEVIVLGKKIISSEISAVGFIQMDFNRRQRKIDLIFKMNYFL